MSSPLLLRQWKPLLPRTGGSHLLHQGYSAEVVPLQAQRNDVLPGHPEAQRTVVQYTTVNVVTEQPKDHVIWSLWCFFYGNPCCLGLAALIYSIKARDRKMVGDLDGARQHGSTARCLNIVATLLVSFIILITIIIVCVTAAQVSSQVTSFSYDSRYRG